MLEILTWYYKNGLYGHCCVDMIKRCYNVWQFIHTISIEITTCTKTFSVTTTTTTTTATAPAAADTTTTTTTAAAAAAAAITASSSSSSSFLIGFYVAFNSLGHITTR